MDCFGFKDRLLFGILRRRWLGCSVIDPDLYKMAAGLDAQTFASMLAAHGLTGIVLKFHRKDLVELFGLELVRVLQASYVIAAMKNRIRLQALKTIRDAFDGERIPWVLLKGAGLSMQLYGDESIRSSGDIDILVDPASENRAISVLQKVGFSLIDGASGLHGLSRWVVHNNVHHHVLVGAGNIIAELHWRSDFSPHLSLPPLALLAEHPVRVQLLDYDVPCLALETLTIYVARHAYRSTWLRWKWLYDTLECYEISAAISSASAQRLTREPAVIASLSLAKSMFQIDSETAWGRAASSTYQWKRAIELRDAEAQRLNAASMGKASIAIWLNQIVKFASHVAFQSRAISSFSGRLRYIVWRLVRVFLGPLG